MRKQKVELKRKTKKIVPSAHLSSAMIDDLVIKIVNAVDIEEKIKWSWGIMQEYQVLISSPIAKKHMEKCKSCHEFLIARKCLAELVIQAGRR
jgi:hypothetical protein